MKIAVLSALGDDMLRRCINSLLETSSLTHEDIFIIRERRSREETLNAALDIIGRGDDILFVGDDITFTAGWQKAIRNGYGVADIIGLTTLYPGTDIIQDNGYDLVKIDNSISLEAKNRRKRIREIKKGGYRLCDATCGCLMLVKKKVFKLVPAFSGAGSNRWGEFIFQHLAKRKRAKIAALNHYVYHDGISTKSNPDKRLSSLSYQLEKKIWKSIVGRYVDKKMVKAECRRIIADNLFRILDSCEKILLYGAGTVSEFILEHIGGKAVTVCSGLAEEWGKVFYGYKIADYKKALRKNYDLVIITTLYIEKDVYKQYILPVCKNISAVRLIGVSLDIKDSRYLYDAKRIV